MTHRSHCVSEEPGTLCLAASAIAFEYLAADVDVRFNVTPVCDRQRDENSILSIIDVPVVKYADSQALEDNISGTARFLRAAQPCAYRNFISSAMNASARYTLCEVACEGPSRHIARA